MKEMLVQCHVGPAGRLQRLLMVEGPWRNRAPTVGLPASVALPGGEHHRFDGSLSDGRFWGAHASPRVTLRRPAEEIFSKAHREQKDIVFAERLNVSHASAWTPTGAREDACAPQNVTARL
jgi:hypothetical protein